MAKGKVVIDRKTGKQIYIMTLSDLVMVSDKETLTDWIKKRPNIEEELSDEGNAIATSRAIKAYIDESASVSFFNGVIDNVPKIEQYGYSQEIAPENIYYVKELGFFVGEVKGSESQDVFYQPKYYNYFVGSERYNNANSVARRIFIQLDTLSSSNLKTINGQSIVGKGNIVISGGGGGGDVTSASNVLINTIEFLDATNVQEALEVITETTALSFEKQYITIEELKEEMQAKVDAKNLATVNEKTLIKGGNIDTTPATMEEADVNEIFNQL